MDPRPEYIAANLVMAAVLIGLAVWDVNLTVRGGKQGLVEDNGIMADIMARTPKGWMYIRVGGAAIVAAVAFAINTVPITQAVLFLVLMAYLVVDLGNNDIEKPGA